MQPMLHISIAGVYCKNLNSIRFTDTPGIILIYRPKDGSWCITESNSCKAKITYFELTISICQNIFWFKISNIPITCMYVLQSSKQLIEEKLVVFWSQVVVGLYNLVQIRLHEFKNNINVLEFSPRRRKQNMFYFHDIWVSQ
ncbi:Os11g0271675 [Oryza sativa Japonica Group]|uniref:Os11g0271675 protein n=1 Tax=Oryza sativa subsp. japonica TaxID=39947 RepID=A0A0P0Y1X9_ORYSJ|nr:hypothetical protein EE612_054703 [Oryza sativa]BAT13564.1 Os11g0271675 [Oryza sativa Japonica Group]